jgi:DNA uptake protein ComE-like DNA-binding protein
LSQKDLAAHPLLNYTQARDIVSLRRISGVIKTIADISALPSFDARTIERIKPLLRFEK